MSDNSKIHFTRMAGFHFPQMELWCKIDSRIFFYKLDQEVFIFPPPGGNFSNILIINSLEQAMFSCEIRRKILFFF